MQVSRFRKSESKVEVSSLTKSYKFAKSLSLESLLISWNDSKVFYQFQII